MPLGSMTRKITLDKESADKFVQRTDVVITAEDYDRETGLWTLWYQYILRDDE